MVNFSFSWQLKWSKMNSWATRKLSIERSFHLFPWTTSCMQVSFFSSLRPYNKAYWENQMPKLWDNKKHQYRTGAQEFKKKHTKKPMLDSLWFPTALERNVKLYFLKNKLEKKRRVTDIFFFFNKIPSEIGVAFRGLSARLA